MRQRTYSDIKPEKGFNIENVENGKCTVLFFDDIKEEIQEIENFENKETETKKVYSYDIYTLETVYRENLAERIEENIEKWLKNAKDVSYNEAAAEVRTKRNELLKESDAEMCIDRLGIEIPETINATNLLTVVTSVFKGLGSILNNNMSKYRQELRDITKQEGFPYNIKWPNKEDLK